MVVDSKDEVLVQVMTGATQALILHSNASAKTFVLTEPEMPSWIAELTYDDSKQGLLALSGKMGLVPIVIRLHKEDMAQYPLGYVSFGWIHDVVK